ncbi:hemagglutinin repeat-containing protein, partial [Pseudomonas syringae]|uniref:hemagglutinin repeat-containing protein n=1 Tax=Pseudomonas syringae TaxID=317 RepID=UPI0018E60538
SKPQKYLIETNPVLTDLKQFMSSDYLLAGLGYDPEVSAKRLGDGLYEQRLVQQAVVARTGQAFIDGQTSNEAQFKYLMNNAIASKQQLNLAVGVSLNSQQVAALTHDIVWLEEHEVNGEKVLVPVLYMAQADNRLGPTGALIAGNDVSLIAGQNLDNVGTLRAANNLSAAAGNDLVNSGLIEAGNRLDLLAGNDLINKSGGIIAGRDVTLTALRGDVINERTVTSHQSASGDATWRQDFADNAARIEAANDMSLQAGRDVKNTGSVLQAGRDLSIAAGRDVAIDSAQTENGQTRGANSSNSSITQLGSTVSAGRDLTAQAGRDINVIASSIDAKRDIAMAATENLTLSSAADEQHSYGKSKKVTEQEDHVSQVSADLKAGGSVALQAGQNLDIIASRINAGSNIALDAAQDLTIASAQDESSYFYAKKSKGSFGRSSSKQQESYDSSNVASVINAGQDLTINTTKAADGSVSINGGHDVSIIGSRLSAGNDLVLGATNDVTVLSGVDEQGAYSQKRKSGSFGVSKSGKSELKTSATQVASELSAGNDVVVASGKDITLRASNIDAGNDVDLRAGLVDKTGDINLLSANDEASSHSDEYKKKTGLSVSGGFLSISSAKEAGGQAQSSTSVGSQINAAGNVSLQTERDINIVGSGVNAGANVSLNAGQDVNILAAQSTQSNQDWEKNRQSGIGVSSNANGVTFFAGVDRTKERNRLEQQSAAASQVRAGEDLTVNAKRDINQVGSDLQALNDINLTAGRNIKIDAARESQTVEQQRENSRNGLSASIDHNYGSTKDAISGAGKGEDATSKGSSTLKAVDSTSQFLSGPTGDGKFGNSKQGTSQQVVETTNRASTLDAGNNLNISASNDVQISGGQLQAGRDINIKGRDVTLDAAKGSYSQETSEQKSWSGIHGSSSGGFKLGVGGSSGIAKGDQSQEASTVTTLQAGRDVTIKASNDLNLIGTQAQAERNINLNAGNTLNIKAAQNDSSTENTRKNGGGEAGIAIGPGGIGVYASVNIGKGDLEREGKQQQEAYLYAGNHLGFTSGQDTNIAGATLRGNDVVGRVGRDLNVTSLPDTGKAQGKEFDLSATVVVGFGGSVSGSVGYGQTNGSKNWIEEQTRITAKDKVDIRTENHTQFDGALIASDSGNLKLDTNTLGYSDIAGKDKEHGYYLNVGGSYGTGSSTTQDSSQVGKGDNQKNGWSVEGWNYNKDREQIVRGTVGAGDVVVRSDTAGKDSAAGLNRDVDKAYEITRDDEHRTDVYVTKSSVEAVSQPVDTAKQWSNQLLTYNETARQNYEEASRGLTRAVNKIESTLGRKMDAGAASLMGADFAENTLDSLLQGGMTRSQAMKTMADPAFQETVVAEIARLAGIDLTSVEVLDQTLQTDNKANSPGSIELPATPVNSSDAERLTAAQDTLRSMASINQYIQEHPEQQEAVSVLVAVAQGPKGLVQLAVFNAVSETPLGQNIGQRLAEYGEVLGEQVANAMEGEKINKDDNTGAYLIGGGVLTAGILTGMLVSGKSVAKSRTISAEMKADPYHPDWKSYTGTDKGVGADFVKGGGAKATGEAATQIPGRVQSRVNIANGRTETTPLRDNGNPVSAGFDHVIDGHFNREISTSRSVFTIAPDELKGILQSSSVVKSPVIALPDGQFVRTVDVGRAIGTTTLKDGGIPTSVIKVFTDKAGNLITTFPVKVGN